MRCHEKLRGQWTLGHDCSSDLCHGWKDHFPTSREGLKAGESAKPDWLDIKARVFFQGLAEAPSERIAINEIYRFFHSALTRGNYTLVDKVFETADEKSLVPATTISFLIATIPMKARLSFRVRRKFVARAKKSIRTRFGRNEAAEILYYL
jgi:hypothetical protein